VLSIAPSFVILLTVTGFVWERNFINGQLYSEINKLVSSDAALQIQTSIQNILNKDNVLLRPLVSSNVSASRNFEIQDSLNRILGLKIKQRFGGRCSESYNISVIFKFWVLYLLFLWCSMLYQLL
jgi:membrane protein